MRNDAGNDRTSGLVARAVIYLLIGWIAILVAVGHSGRQPNQEGALQLLAGKPYDLTASVMRHSGGRWLVAIIGLIVVVVGVMLIAQGLRRAFMKYLMTSRMSAKVRRVVERLGQIGVTARGVIFTITGALIVEAAVTFKPSKSGGLDKAPLTLRGEPFGEFLLLLAALGLVVFGVYGLAEARWRRV